MAKIDLTSKDWCELIFKDRNKEYGAYDMRLDTPKRHNLATLIVIVVVILVITLPMLIKFITPEKENKIVVNEVTTLAKLPEAEIKRNEELQPMWQQLKDHLKGKEINETESHTEKIDERIYALNRICRVVAVK